MKLLELEPFDTPAETKNKLFVEAMKSEIRFHYENNSLYRNFLNRRSFDPYGRNFELSDIPFIPAQIFKHIGSKLSSVSDEALRMSLKSSATSGIPSIVQIDGETSKRQRIVMSKVMSQFIGSERRTFGIIDLHPSKDNNNSVQARSAAIKGYLNFASNFEFFVEKKPETNEHRINLEKFQNWVKSLPSDKPVIIFGFTFLLYTFLARDFRKADVTVNLPEGSKVIHIGGWKKLEENKVPKNIFNEEISKTLNIEASNIIDIYGFTEQMGLNYPDCSAGWKHVNSYSEVLCRDEKSLEIIPDGAVGLLQFLTPIPHSYPGNSVLTDDLGVIEHGLCECGNNGSRFRIVGRAKKAEPRGCGDILAEKITTITKTKNVDNFESRYQCFFPTNFEATKTDEAKEQLTNSIIALNAKKDWILNQSVDDLISLINLAREKWATDPSLTKYKNTGLNFLINWSSPDRLSNLLDAGLDGKKGHLDTYLKRKDIPTSSKRAYPVGLVSHWLSGNVPLLGMFMLIQSILTKNVNLIKVSDNGSEVIVSILNAFKGIEYLSPSGKIVYGNDLLETICVVYFDRNEEVISKIFSTAADARVAWGGSSAVAAITSLPKKYNCQDLIFGPKLSTMAVTSDTLNNEKLTRKLFKRIALDISAFDQFACASPHTIFIEKNSNFEILKFIDKLRGALEKTLVRLPIPEPDSAQANKIRVKIALHEFLGNAWFDEKLRWTILLGYGVELDNPTFWRTITIRQVNKIEEIYELMSDDIQTVAISAPQQRKIQIANELQKRGVSRCPDIGMMTHFDSPWDGMSAINRLTRWGTVGGPI